MKRKVLALLFALALMISLVPAGAVQESNPSNVVASSLGGDGRDFKPGEVIVKINTNARTARMGSMLNADLWSSLVGLNVTEVEDLSDIDTPGDAINSYSVGTPDVFLLTLADSTSQSVVGAVEALEDNPLVEFAQPNYIYRTAGTANDSYWSRLWGLHKIRTAEAWDITTGSSSVLVGVLDTGVNYNHIDLRMNLNTALGYNSEKNTRNLADLLDGYGHGTHVAGTIGAIGNNREGVVGVSHNVTLVPVKINIDNQNWAYSTSIYRALLYAESTNLKIVNISFQFFDRDADSLIQSGINAYQGLVVGIAGNYGRDIDNYIPYNCDNLIIVGNSTANDKMASGSGYGARSVDLFAPGSGIYSTFYDGGYRSMSGTSMAAPHVTGTAALLWAYDPTLTVAEVKEAIVNSVDKVPALSNLCISGGRLNAYKALQSVESKGAEIVPGYIHTLALKPNGTVWARGSNMYGECGKGTITNQEPWGQVLSDVKAVSNGGSVALVDFSGGTEYSLALKHDGTVWAWGNNKLGQLGDGTTTSRTVPVQVRGLNNVVAISAGQYHSLALKSDGTVWAWGDNSVVGALGNGSTVSSSIPVQVTGLNGITAISSGYYFSMALKSDGTVWAWGYNGGYQLGLGDGTTTPRTTPVQVAGLSDVTAISSGSSHTTVLKSDGTVWIWGRGVSGLNSRVPKQVPGLSNVTDISSGFYFTLALKRDGTVWGWGDNSYGQLSDGTLYGSYSPIHVGGITGATAISAGAFNGTAVKEDGSVWAWGWNTFSQLVENSTNLLSSPVNMPLP